MKRIVLDCHGRLANQCLCYANAVHVLSQLKLTDRIIVINYSIPEHCVHFPGAVVEQCKIEHLPRVTRNEISKQSGDCLWIWEDLFSNFPKGDEIETIIKSIQLEHSFESQLSGTINSDSFVGIHARFGDYVSIDPANPPQAMPPFVRGSNEYFMSAMEMCREAIPDVRFFLASDGTNQELEFITRYPNVILGWPGQPLFDLFALSKCRLIIGSASTFSAVAATYGNIPMTVPTMSAKEIKQVVDKAKS